MLILMPLNGDDVIQNTNQGISINCNQPVKIQIFDIQGKLIYQKNSDSGKIISPNCINQILIVKVVSGKNVWIKKVSI